MKLLYWPDPLLSQPSRKLDFTDPCDVELYKTLVPEMAKVMLAHDGAGLAAIQVGQPVNLVVVADKNAPDGYSYYANVGIVDVHGEKRLVREGCLSAPGVFEQVRRHPQVMVRYETIAAEYMEKLSVRNSHVMQHECEHLAGKFFFDHLSGLRRARAYTTLTRTVPR